MTREQAHTFHMLTAQNPVSQAEGNVIERISPGTLSHTPLVLSFINCWAGNAVRVSSGLVWSGLVWGHPLSGWVSV
jgi:hypothetical protein